MSELRTCGITSTEELYTENHKVSQQSLNSLLTLRLQLGHWCNICWILSTHSLLTQSFTEVKTSTEGEERRWKCRSFQHIAHHCPGWKKQQWEHDQLTVLMEAQELNQIKRIRLTLFCSHISRRNSSDSLLHPGPPPLHTLAVQQQALLLQMQPTYSHSSWGNAI